ncbi:NarK family nitrate/nitrite MFS transporter [Marinoscillum sp. 108]|uniref:NarK family nitrate/nitrite MFS transporter n=1 Tax=Marinoscillum sp. 108 TaxID=2653151 RepID=UPI0012F2E6E8|nr:NarK family nitrate/nitrite MFS transporter [Marinoscillum sp. 108]VXD13992.1 NNP family nitrate/nitrite transporter-like MFS transporter [Marinoscillum sp. 108]
METTQSGKAKRIELFNLRSINMRVFHLTWLAFFLCFFGWFGIAPMLSIVRDDLGITTDQIVNTNMIAVASTVFMRLIIGWLCDRIGPRITYTWLLILGSIPVMMIGMAQNYEQFLIARMFIGAIGAAFVITQFHTSVMFAPNVVGTANATTAGWGNLGGGVTQQVMPVVFAGVLAYVGAEHLAWRYAMIGPGVLLFVMGFVYYRFTQDTPEGNYKDLPNINKKKSEAKDSIGTVLKDHRVWVLFLIYGACFGVELIVNSKAALYFTDYFDMDIKTAGLIAGLFGLMNLFARSLGGYFGDRFGKIGGLNGRVKWLFVALFMEGLALILFSRMDTIPLIIMSLIFFSLFVQMSEGATYSVVPFINKKALGMVSGIVGAGGNAGAVAGMLLFKKQLTGLEWTDSFYVLGFIVLGVSFSSFLVRFTKKAEVATPAANKEVTVEKHLQPELAEAI